METTTLVVHPAWPVGVVDPRVFGGFLEHLGRAVYEGIFDPGNPLADAHGCRADVLAALGQLELTAMRYPGGNFASAYHWHDGVGPVARATTVREPAWKSVETNRFGTDELLALAERMGWQPMLAVNLGTGTPEEAADWVEYCNAPTGTRYADERAANGREEPWNVRMWCLGNEMDGDWQIGHLPAEQYGRVAQQAAQQMRLVDPTIETIVCGSSLPSLPTAGHWDRTVLEIVGTEADYLSVHRYVGNHTGDVADYLAVGLVVDRQIDELDALCRWVSSRHDRPERVYLCVDEWNVWYRNFEMDGAWTFAPHLLEETYDLADALVTAQFLISFLRHADSVKIANLAQIVNVIAPVMTRADGLLLQAPFHAMRMIRDVRGSTSLRVSRRGPTYDSPSHGTTPVVDAAVVLDDTELTVVAVNRSTTSAAPLRLEIPEGRLLACLRAEVLTASAPDASNSWEQPETVIPITFDAVELDGTAAVLELPPLSLVVATLAADLLKNPG